MTGSNCEKVNECTGGRGGGEGGGETGGGGRREGEETVVSDVWCEAEPGTFLPLHRSQLTLGLQAVIKRDHSTTLLKELQAV